MGSKQNEQETKKALQTSASVGVCVGASPSHILGLVSGCVFLSWVIELSHAVRVAHFASACLWEVCVCVCDWMLFTPRGKSMGEYRLVRVGKADVCLMRGVCCCVQV